MRPPTATRGRRPGVLYAHMLEGEPHPAAYQGATPADGAAQPTHSTRARAHPRAHYLLDQHGPSPTSQKENDDRRSSQRRSAQKPHIWSSSPHMADIRLHLRPTLTTSTSSPHPPPPRLAGDVPQRVARQRGPGPPPRLVGSAARACKVPAPLWDRRPAATVAGAGGMHYPHTFKINVVLYVVSCVSEFSVPLQRMGNFPSITKKNASS
jgi:hypothetical protein